MGSLEFLGRWILACERDLGAWDTLRWVDEVADFGAANLPGCEMLAGKVVFAPI